MKTLGSFILTLGLVLGIVLLLRPSTTAQAPGPPTGPLAGALVPAGVVVPFAGDVVPNGWLLCDGSTVSSNDFPALFNAIGEAHGDGGDGPDGLFDLPDYRGRFLRGVDAKLGPRPG